MSETFMGVPAAEPGRVDARVALLGAGMASPYRGQGAYAARAPAALRAAAGGWADLAGHVNFDLGRVGWEPGAVVDCGDLALDPADGAGNRLRIRHAVSEVLGRGAVPVVLGGDCSVAVPVLQGFDGHGPVAVLQIDAHIDWREQIEGERWGLSSAMRRVSEMGQVSAMVQVGARGLGSARPGDLAAARDWGARIVTAEALAQEGIDAALAGLPDGVPVVVALDVDVLDPAVMPAVMAPTAGGLAYREVLALLRAVVARGPVAGLVMTELVPERDIDGQGVRLAAQLLTSALGLLAGEDTPGTTKA